jgi:hypothetical protein
MGIDTGRYGYEQFQEATNPLKSEGKKAIKGLSKMFGGEMEEIEGDGFFKDIKKNINIKIMENETTMIYMECTLQLMFQSGQEGVDFVQDIINRSQRIAIEGADYFKIVK